MEDNKSLETNNNTTSQIKPGTARHQQGEVILQH